MLETLDRVKLAAGRGQYEAPAINIEFFVEADNACRIRINFAETADTGTVDSTDVRYTAAEMDALNDEYSGLVNNLRFLIDSAAKTYLVGVNPSANIDVV